MPLIRLLSAILTFAICGHAVAWELQSPNKGTACEWINQWNDPQFAVFNRANVLGNGQNCNTFSQTLPFVGGRHSSTIRARVGHSIESYSGFRVIVKPTEGKNLTLARIVAMDRRSPVGPIPTDRYYDRVPTLRSARFSFFLEGMQLVTEYMDDRSFDSGGNFYIRDVRTMNPVDLTGDVNHLGELHLDVRMNFDPPATSTSFGRLWISVCTSRGTNCRNYNSAGYHNGQTAFGQLPPDLELGLEVPYVDGVPREAAFCRLLANGSYSETCSAYVGQ
jgi:hypothetical protein